VLHIDAQCQGGVPPGIAIGRCLTGVDSSSKGAPEFVAIDEQPNHEIVHVLRLGEAQRAADEALDPGPQIDMFALNFLGVLLAYLMLLSIGSCTSSVRVNTRGLPGDR
jgi:hypothetical protein